MNTYPTTNETRSPVRSSLEDIKLIDLWINLKSHKWLFAKIALGIFCLSIVYLLLATPSYQANVLIQIDDQSDSSLGALSDVEKALSLNKPIDGELDVLKSRAVVGAAVEATQAQTQIGVKSRLPVISRLYAHFETPPDHGLAQAPFGWTRFAWGGESLRLANFEVPAELYKKNFTLTTVGTDAWTLADPDGDLIAQGRIGQRVAFTVQTRFGERDGSIQVKSIDARPGIRFALKHLSYQETLTALSNKLNVTETTKDSSMIAVKFENPNPTFAADFTNALAAAYLRLKVDHKAEQARLSLQFLNQKLPELETQLDQSEDRMTKFRTQTNTIEVKDQIKALLARAETLEQGKALLQLSLQSMGTTLQPDHPAMKAAQAQLDTVESDEKSLENQIQTLPSVQQQYLRLARDVEVNTDLYTALKTNAQQLEVVAAGTTGEASLIDPAIAPDAVYWPKPSLILAGGLIGGLLIAFVVVQALAALHEVLRDPLEVERTTQVALFAVIADSSSENDSKRRIGINQPRPLLAHSQPFDASIEAVRTLRATMKFTFKGAGTRVVVFTGPSKGVGKTFVSANFAYLLAANGQRVLLVDGDMRHSSMKRYFPEVAGSTGLVNVLIGDAKLADVIRHSGHDNLDLLSAGTIIPPNPSELLERSALHDLLVEARSQYDYIILDTPPVLPVSDAISLGQQADAVFLVSRYGVTSRQELTDTVLRLRTAGITPEGNIFNGYEAMRYGYGSYAYTYGET